MAAELHLDGRKTQREKEIYTMSVHSAAYEAYVLELLAAPPDSFDHLTAVAVATCATDDALEKLLFSMYLEDPKGSHEFEVAVTLLSLHYRSTVTA